ncbi:hypothetical protein [Streptomyces sp. MBT28]|uniref:hypothetical protein n=1 Tax=Streptomyces sp. MBT28 TaxID=1488357 RepID=UPI00061934A1|nr:hypothetical protein [Streptomyces sp. MBT28]
MTVHIDEQPERAGSLGTDRHGSSELPMSPPVPEPQPHSTKIKVLVVLLAVVTGITSAFGAYIIGTHVAEGAAEPVIWAAATFVATTTLMIHLSEKTGLIE